jgi:hypothetical protein
MIIDLLKSNIKEGILIYRENGHPCWVLGLLDKGMFLTVRNSWDQKLIYGYLKVDTLTDDMGYHDDKCGRYTITAIYENPSPEFIAFSLNMKFNSLEHFLSSAGEFNFDNINTYRDDRQFLLGGNVILDRNRGVHIIVGIHEGIVHTIDRSMTPNQLPLGDFHPNLYSKVNMKLGIKCIFSGPEAIAALFNKSYYSISNSTIDSHH